MYRKPVLGQIINENQKGFIKGRYIGENIRMVYDALFYAKLQHKPRLLLIDFEKAFDSISWNFLQEALNKFNFGPPCRNGFIYFIMIFNRVFYK